MGAIEGRIRDVMPAPSGGIARFKVSAPKLSNANIGGVALNEAGETIGIVDGLEGNEASILPAALIDARRNACWNSRQACRVRGWA